MKATIKNVIAIGMSVYSLCACSDFLDKSDPTKMDSNNFYKTESDFEQAANGVYSQLQDYTSNIWMYKEFITDNTTCHFNTQDRGQGAGIEAMEYWQINATTMEQ